MIRFASSLRPTFLFLCSVRKVCWRLTVALFVSAACNAALAGTAERTTLLVSSEVDYPPYAIVTPDGTPDGFSVDLIKAVSKVMGVEIEFRVAAWNEVKGQLERGEIDILPHVYYSQERDAVFDFSATHTSADAAFFVRSGEFRDMTIADLNGKSIIAMRSDWTHEHLLKQGISADIELVDTVPEALRHLAAGNHDVAFLPHLVGLLVAHDLQLGNVETLGDVVPVGRGFAFAVTEGNEDLRMRLDEALAIVRASGRYDEIYDEWFGRLGPGFEEHLQLLKFVLFGGGAVILVIGAWSASLRRQVKVRTRELESIKAGLEQRVDERTKALSREVEERKQAEEALRKSERFLAEAQEIAHIGNWWLNARTGQLHWSDEIYRIFGRDPGEFEPSYERFFETVHPDDVAAIKRSEERAFSKGEKHSIDHRIALPDGTVRWVHEEAVPTLGEDGELTYLAGTVQDITERKSIEERLHQAQKMEAVGQLTGGVAHDFNNLLAVILGNTELLQDQLGREGRPLNAVRRAATRGAELTQRLLAFSRQQPLMPQAIDLGELVPGMSDLLARTLGETIEIETRTAPNLWSALADPGQVENALLNLALNARDAMPDGGKLTIECANASLDSGHSVSHMEATPGDYVTLAVSDTGGGMTPEVLDHVFEPFYTTKEVGQGSGLGLSMVYGFARQSGGHAIIQSEEGQGTAVKLYLPRAEAAVRRGEESRDEHIPEGRAEEILVIEDDPDVRDLVVLMLEDLGYRVIQAPTTAEAPKVLADGGRVDLVLSDVVLPGGTSGPEFAEEACAAHPDLKIIFMSGYPADAAKRNGFLDSQRALLSKPFQRKQLAKAVHEALG